MSLVLGGASALLLLAGGIEGSGSLGMRFAWSLGALAAASAALAARDTAPEAARGSWVLLAVGSLAAGLGPLFGAGVSPIPGIAFPSVDAILLIVFHLAIAEAAIVALRPARDARLQFEVALDGVLVLLMAVVLALAIAIDEPLAMGWLSSAQAAAMVIAQAAVAASLVFSTLLVYWRDTELSRPVVDGLLVSLVFLSLGHFSVVIGSDIGGNRITDLIRGVGWLTLTAVGWVGMIRPGPTPGMRVRTVAARRIRRLAIPGVALFLTWWGVHVSGRDDVSHLSVIVVVTMGTLLAARMIAGVVAMERESEDLRLAEERVARLRLRAVSAQMNPHFLFNALHSLSAMIRRDPDGAGVVVERLGALLRYGLDAGDDLVPLADEWEFATRYLDLQQVRLRDRLRVRTEVSDEALDILVPPFVLQPLVENAIHHAIDPDPAGGEIELLADVDRGSLVVRVRDTGSGTDAATIREAGGVGIRGVRAQMETYMTEGSWALEPHHLLDGRFEMQLRMPAD
ncbi:MAG: histidine kinase [Longimicrobiales bacterium]|nr:histidine kinase [Longimicrobiales bacterium]